MRQEDSEVVFQMRLRESCSQRWTDWDRSMVRRCEAWTFWRAVRCALCAVRVGCALDGSRVNGCQMMMWRI